MTGSGADTIALIALPPFNTHTLTAVNDVVPVGPRNTDSPIGLPVITSEITIDGGSLGSTIVRDDTAPEFGILAVDAGGNLALRGTTVTRGVGFAGGGIHNRGTLTLGRSTVSGNSAIAFGGGIFNTGSGTMTLTVSTVSGNATVGLDSLPGIHGGGIYNAGTMTLNVSTVSGNTTFFEGGGIYNTGTLTLMGLSTVSGNTAIARGGGIWNRGTLTLDVSTVSGNSAGFFGGGINNAEGTVTLRNGSTVSGNASQIGGGIRNDGGLVTLTNSTVTLNSASGPPAAGFAASGLGGGIVNGGLNRNATLTLTNSTVSGNSSNFLGGGIENGSGGTLTLTNSTLSGNSAAENGGGVYSGGTLTLTNSTVSGNSAGRVGGGLFNRGTATLVQSLLSGNTAPVIAPEAYTARGTVIADSFNLFGHDGFSAVAGFTLGATDLVPAVPVPSILDPMLGLNGGRTSTHALVFGSPAVDAVPGAACATGTDQRGALRPQDADGDTIPDCDIGAVERGLVPIQAAILSTTLDCRPRGCRVSVRCNLLETECRNPIDITVRSRAVRAADGTLVRGPERFRFAAGVTNIPPGGTQTMRLPLTPRGTRVVRTTKMTRLNGLLAIREIGAPVTNTPPISNTRVILRLRRR